MINNDLTPPPWRGGWDNGPCPWPILPRLICMRACILLTQKLKHQHLLEKIIVHE